MPCARAPAYNPALACSLGAFRFTPNGVIIRGDGMFGKLLRGLTRKRSPARTADIDTQFADGLRLLDLGRYREAEVALAHVLSLAPDHAAAWQWHGWALWHLGEAMDAARELVRAWTLEPELRELEKCLATVLPALRPDAMSRPTAAPDVPARFAQANQTGAAGQHEVAMSCMHQVLADLPDFPFAVQRLACLAALKGELEEAQRWFSQSGFTRPATSTSQPDGWINLDPDFLVHLGADARWPPTGEPAEGAEAVILIACDARYFRFFAYPFLRSLQQHGGVRLIVHLHVHDADPWIEQEVEALPRGGNLTTLEVSHERGTYTSKAQARTHYACARLRLIPELLARHRLPVILSDIDVLTLRSLTPLLECLQSGGNRQDVALLRWSPHKWQVWDHVSASTVLVSPTPAGHRFACAARAYVDQFIARPDGAWYLDQVALFAAWQALQRHQGFSAGFIPPQWIAQEGQRRSDLAPEAMFWTATANIGHLETALASEIFTSFQPETRTLMGWMLPGKDSFFGYNLMRAPASDGRPQWEHDLKIACQPHFQGRRRALDIGAHVGFWSDWLAPQFAHVDAFEPHPLMQRCFAANVRQANVTLHPVGLADAAMQVAMLLDPFNSGMSHVDLSQPGSIPLARVDDFKFDDIDFIKLDTEGFETRVLSGARETLLRCRPLVLLEEIGAYQERYGDAPESAGAFLLSLGARVVARLPENNTLYAWPAGS